MKYLQQNRFFVALRMTGGLGYTVDLPHVDPKRG
jgi:hypothetical protein